MCFTTPLCNHRIFLKQLFHFCARKKLAGKLRCNTPVKRNWNSSSEIMRWWHSGAVKPIAHLYANTIWFVLTATYDTTAQWQVTRQLPEWTLVRTPNGQISKIMHLIEIIFNICYCEIWFVVFHCNAGRYHAKFCFSSKTRVSHFTKSLEAAWTSLKFCFEPVRTLVFRKIVTHDTISGVLSCYCTSVISRFSLFYDASQPRVTFHISYFG